MFDHMRALTSSKVLRALALSAAALIATAPAPPVTATSVSGDRPAAGSSYKQSLIAVALSGPTATATDAGRDVFYFEVVDLLGRPAAGVAFAATTISSPTGACGGLMPTSGVTDASGKVSIIYGDSANPSPAWCTLRFTPRSPSERVDVHFTSGGAGTLLQLSATPASPSIQVRTGSTEVVVQTPYDPVPFVGDLIEFAPTKGHGCGGFGPAGISYAYMDSTGTARATYQAGSLVGLCIVTIREVRNGIIANAVVSQT
jgi:hypothetical protein